MIYYESKYGVLYEGDCLEIMPSIQKKVDLVLTDPPYGTTTCSWDSVIPFDRMWGVVNNIISPGGAVVMTAAQPFTSFLIASNVSRFKYSLVWKKSKIGHFAQAPYRFLTEHEDIVVFSDGGTSKNAKLRMVYNPQGTKPCNKRCKGKGFSEHRKVKTVQDDYTQTTTNYPKSILEFASDFAKNHPTQKPVALMEYLIKTYTNIGDTVLDFTIGSGTTAVAAIITGRKFIGIEMNEDYCEIAKQRIIEAEKKQEDLFGDI